MTESTSPAPAPHWCERCGSRHLAALFGAGAADRLVTPVATPIFHSLILLSGFLP
jgi:hypothetical protein